MPAYTTIEFVVSRKRLSPNLVADFYRAIQSHGVKFDKVLAWGCSEAMTLEEIISWNQKKLESNFRLGFSEDVSNDYRQILLSGTPYSECRLYIFNAETSFSFCLIVPESELSEYEVPDFGLEILKDISRNVLSIVSIEAIQSYDELSPLLAIDELACGARPTVDHFGFIKNKAFEGEERYQCTALGDGYFIEVKR